jgi:general secretion pathway protein D
MATSEACQASKQHDTGIGRRFVLWLLAMVAISVCVSALPVAGYADEAPAVEYYPQPTESEAQLANALEQRVEFNFVDTSLADVANWLQDELGHTVVLDIPSLKDAGVDGNLRITGRAKSVSLRAALRIILDQFDLAWILRDSLLLITTADRAENDTIVRVYPVGDLVAVSRENFGTGGRPTLEKPTNVAEDVSAGQPPEEQTDKSKEKVPAETPVAEPCMVADYDSLIELIVTSVRPQSWPEGTGPGPISIFEPGKCLVISQTRPVHDEIGRLLRALRAAKQASNGE